MSLKESIRRRAEEIDRQRAQEEREGRERMEQAAKAERNAREEALRVHQYNKTRLEATGIPELIREAHAILLEMHPDIQLVEYPEETTYVALYPHGFSVPKTSAIISRVLCNF